MALHSYFQDSSSVQHNSCCAFALHRGTSVLLPLVSTDSAAVHTACRGASAAYYPPDEKVKIAATELAILFLKSCLLHASPLQHASLQGTSLLTRISTSVDLVNISRQFCLM